MNSDSIRPYLDALERDIKFLASVTEPSPRIAGAITADRLAAEEATREWREWHRGNS